MIAGVQYHNTFAPRIHPASLQVILVTGAARSAIINQCDIKNAYLNGHLDESEVIFMDLPPAYKKFCVVPPLLKANGQVVCRLLHPLYGMKQGANKCYQELKKFFIEIGFMVSISDEAVFYHTTSTDEFIIVGVATDDFTIVASSQSVADVLKTKLNNCFKIVDLGAIVYECNS